MFSMLNIDRQGMLTIQKGGCTKHMQPPFYRLLPGLHHHRSAFYLFFFLTSSLIR